MSATGPAAPLDPRKFRDPLVTAAGEPRARVEFRALETLWINTGTLCNIACANCYIESSPTNDRLAYIRADEAAACFDEIERDRLGTRTIGFTGGEPFMNPGFLAMLGDALGRGFEALVLTNAMKPMWNRRAGLLALRERFGARLRVRVSVDHHTRAGHEAVRGPRTWEPTVAGLEWLRDNGFALAIAARRPAGETEAEARAGFARFLAARGLALDAADPEAVVLFPEMDAAADVQEITARCWSLLSVSPGDQMCATARMVVKRRGADRPSVVACTLLPHEPGFELGATLAEAARPVRLNHPHCARFCVLGGASCGGAPRAAAA